MGQQHLEGETEGMEREGQAASEHGESMVSIQVDDKAVRIHR